jgi:hypothetical protein
MVRAVNESGAELHLGVGATVENVFAQKPDVIVLATGSRWLLPQHFRSDSEKNSPVLLPLDEAIERVSGCDAANLGRHVVMVDSSGTYLPLGLADLLSSRGAKVTYVCTNPVLAHITENELELPHILPRLEQRGMTTILAHDIQGIEDGSVILQSARDGVKRTVPAVDGIVFSTQRQSSTELYEALRHQHAGVHRIGDAVSPRETAAAIRDGEALARAL